MPLETPAMETMETLSGKYGTEGDQLLFRILNSGDFMKGHEGEAGDSKSLSRKIAEKGLRYDLTVPLARYVAMHRHDITLPFKRYQIQPVWRADRPQKGRYREFWQCDADVLGTDSLLCEADFVEIYRMVFRTLGIQRYEIRINHRKLLEAAAEKAGIPEMFRNITVIIDKADKIGTEGVALELEKAGLNQQQRAGILKLLKKRTLNKTSLEEIASELSGTVSAEKALTDLGTLAELLGDKAETVILDGSLARGLDYYTGCIFEVVPLDVRIGSISGGGRYDDLTAMFGIKEQISGIGISFGIDRIYDVMDELGLFPEKILGFTDVLFCPMEEAALPVCLPLAEQLRTSGIKTEIYPAAAKIKKQLDYANSKSIAWAVIIGRNELDNGSLVLKNLISGEQIVTNGSSLLQKINH